MTAKTRLNMEHGFMQSIIRNQLDRDNYDKEMKAKAGKKTIPSSHTATKSKKTEVHAYIPPAARSQDGAQQRPSSKKYLFTFEYEDENGRLHHLVVNKGDDASALATEFGDERNFEPAMIDALTGFLQEQIDKYCSLRNS